MPSRECTTLTPQNDRCPFQVKLLATRPPTMYDWESHFETRSNLHAARSSSFYLLTEAQELRVADPIHVSDGILSEPCSNIDIEVSAQHDILSETPSLNSQESTSEPPSTPSLA